MGIIDDPYLIAPCGINCGVCRAYLIQKTKCPGCRADDSNKPISRTKCKIKTCDVFKKDANFCYECLDFPCDNLKRLDKRYRTKYHMSPIENLENIKNLGLKKFLENENKRWSCSNCGGTICVHEGSCISCGQKIN